MQGTWSTIQIAGKEADVYEPSGLLRPRFGILHLHDAGLQRLRDQPVFSRWFDDLKVVCLCPHGGPSWWTDRICREFDLKVTAERFVLDKVLPHFFERWQLRPGAIGLQGISMGGQGALRLAFKHADVFPVVAAIAPAIEYHELYGRGTPLDEMYDSKEQCRQDTVPLHVHPSHYPLHIFFCADPDDLEWYRGSDRLDEKLNALGIPHEVDLRTHSGGHSWDYYNHMAERVERFLYAGLDLQSRRLL